MSKVSHLADQVSQIDPAAQFAKTVLNAAGVNGLGSHSPSAISSVPVVAGPVVMPLPDSTAVAAAQKKQAQLLAAGGGRSSTILSQNNDTLG